MISKICFISASPESTALYTEVLACLPESPPIFGEDIKGPWRLPWMRASRI